MTVKCHVCGKPFKNLRAATQHLFRSETEEHRDYSSYDECEKEIAKSHYGAPNGDNSVVDPDPQAEARDELDRIKSIRDDDTAGDGSGVTTDDDDETADWLTADGGGSEAREPPEPETAADDGSTCPECGADGRPVGELIARWPDELPRPTEASRYDRFCPQCTTASKDGAEIEVWNE